MPPTGDAAEPPRRTWETMRTRESFEDDGDSDEGGSQRPPSNGSFIGRQKRQLRQATLILPRTGERVRRAFTLTNGPRNDAEESDEDAPLLGHGEVRLHGSGGGERRDTALARCTSWTRRALKRPYAFWTSDTGLKILKCSVAYVIASLATFVLPIAARLGRNDSKHLVATVTVYFHPARSVGNMEGAVNVAMVAFVYAAVVSFGSMAVSIFFAARHLEAIGHVIILVVFIGGGLGLVAWTKQRLGDPLVNVACSLASLVLIQVITREESIRVGSFSYEAQLQTLKMVIAGVAISTVVSFTILPHSARKDFRTQLTRTTDLLDDWLSTITGAYLSGTERELQAASADAAGNNYKKSFSALTKALGEAKWEHYVIGTEKEHWVNVKIAKCIETIAQDLRGLRSAAAIQLSLMQSPANKQSRTNTTYTYSGTTSPSPRVQSPMQMDEDPSIASSLLSSINEEPAEMSSPEDSRHFGPQRQSSSLSLHAASTPSDIFALFLQNLGPSMKSLAYTLKEVLGELPFDTEGNVNFNTHFRGSLMDALKLFSDARKQGLAELYRNRSVTKWRSAEVAADYEEVAGSCGYFSSSLQDLAEHTVSYLDVLEELKEIEHSKKRSWTWLQFWSSWRFASEDRSEEQAYTRQQNLREGMPQNFRPKIRRSAQNNQAKQPSYRLRLWKALSAFRRQDVKFAFKVGMGAMVFGMWAFIPSSRPYYNHWRAEWGLLSYMLVCSMTVGASNTTGFQRTWGTCLGAGLAIVAWIIADDNPWVLAFFGWLMSLLGFYVIVGLGKGPMGRFILLSYNLSALYSYSLSIKDADNDDDEGGINPAIWEIALHRVAAVTVGCLWGMIVTRLIWPTSARRKIKDGLAVLWLRMALIWKRDPLNIVIDGTPGFSYMDIRESIALQRYLASLDAVKDAAAFEFNLRGPFETELYTDLLRATGRILDAFYAMNVVISKDLKASVGERELLKATSDERRQLSMRVSHLFSVLASSMKLEYPLNDALPHIEHTRDRMLAKLFQFRTRTTGSSAPTDEDYELLYTYTLVTGRMAEDIAAIERTIESLYGTLNEDSLKLQ